MLTLWLRFAILFSGVSIGSASGYFDEHVRGAIVAVAVTVLALLVAFAFLYRGARSRLQTPAIPASDADYKAAFDAFQARTQGILDASVDAIVTCNRSMAIELFNASAQRMFGYTLDEVKGQSVTVLMPEPYRSDHYIYVRQFMTTGVTRIIGMPRELMGQRKDGSVFPILLSISKAAVHGEQLFTASIRDLSARSGGIVRPDSGTNLHNIDVSPSMEFATTGERKKLKESYDEAMARTQSILNASVDAIVVADTQLVIGVFNLAAEKLFGYSSDEVLGKSVSSLMPEPYSSLHDGYVRHYNETGEMRLIGIPRELVGLRKDRTTFPLLLSLSRGEVGGKTVFSAFLRDLTKEKQRDLLLYETQEKLSNSSGSTGHNNGGSQQLPVLSGAMAASCQLRDIVVGGRLGFGNFGEVFRGRWQSRADVALKRIKDRADIERFAREADILMGLKHPCVVQFLGMYTSPENDLYMVTEYMPLGSLDVLLAVNRFSVDDLLGMIIHAASGMEYLHSRDILHRDLACRNLLVAAGLGGKHVIKVSDFGLACEVYGNYYKSNSKVFPIRWTAPESLDFGRFAKASDVWSFGITMWEIFSGGAVPYPGVANSDILASLRTGYRLPAPAGCPDIIYSAMASCWQTDADKRPTFRELSVLLEANRVVLQVCPPPGGAPGHSASWDQRDAAAPRSTSAGDFVFPRTVSAGDMVPRTTSAGLLWYPKLPSSGPTRDGGSINADYDASAARALSKWR